MRHVPEPGWFSSEVKHSLRSAMSCPPGLVDALVAIASKTGLGREGWLFCSEHHELAAGCGTGKYRGNGVEGIDCHGRRQED